MDTIHFSLVAPEKVLLDRAVSQVVIPGLEGDIGILPNHAPLLTLLRPGVVTVYEDAKVIIRIFVNGGFSEITPEKCVTLVTEGTPLEALNKEALEIQIKNLIEEVTTSKTPEDRKKADQNLSVARAMLMEVLSSGS